MVPALLTRQLLSALRRAEGEVYFINPIAGQVGAHGNIVYATSKHALCGVAESLRKEVREGHRP